jgi:putative nucleotidyltransferase with HDIG domain
VVTPTNTKLVFQIGDRLKSPVYGRLHEDAEPVLLLAAGKRIETEHQLHMLQEAGFTVILSAKRNRPQKLTATTKNARPSPNAAFDQRIEYCMKLRRTVNDATRVLNLQISGGDQPHFDAMFGMSETVVNEVAADPQAFAALTHLRGCDEYTVEHSADVSILMVAMAGVLNLPAEELETIALAGLLHDVGKQMIPEGILTKAGRLTDEEVKIIRRHPEYGMRILSKWEDCPDSVMDVALQHHERLDGSGYPMGTHGNGLHAYSKIASVADTFDAITANRCYRGASPARHALVQLYSARESKYDSAAVDALIKLVGAYPVGTRVQLSTGELGVVIAPNFDDPTHPIVEVDTHPSGRPLTTRYRVRLNGITCWVVDTIET